MNWTAIHDWLYTGSIFGIHRIAWVGLTALAVLEAVLGRAKNPQLRSVASAVALAIQKTLEVTRIAAIPVIGPLVTNVMKAVDGDQAPKLAMTGGMKPRVTTDVKTIETSQPAADPPSPTDPPRAA